MIFKKLAGINEKVNTRSKNKYFYKRSFKKNKYFKKGFSMALHSAIVVNGK